MASDAKLKVEGKDIELHTTTAYPWNGNINIKVVSNKNSKANMMIRIPGWIRNEVVPSDLYKFTDNSNASWMITRNGKKVETTINPQGYVCLNNIKKGDNIAISFDMQPRTVVANSHVKDDKGLVAVERGPLVYCAEWADNNGVSIQNTFLRNNPTFKLINDYSIVNTEADGKPFKVDAITTDAQVLERNANGDLQLKNVNLTLIPYYAWNHRGAGQMDVWLQNKLK
jgi:DUF1680 family protein